MLRAVAKRAGIRALTLKNLRHTFASQLYLAGVNPLEIRELMGHANIRITLDEYIHFALNEKSTAQKLLADRIRQAVGGEQKEEAERIN